MILRIHIYAVNAYLMSQKNISSSRISNIKKFKVLSLFNFGWNSIVKCNKNCSFTILNLEIKISNWSNRSNYSQSVQFLFRTVANSSAMNRDTNLKTRFEIMFMWKIVGNNKFKHTWIQKKMCWNARHKEWGKMRCGYAAMIDKQFAITRWTSEATDLSDSNGKSKNTWIVKLYPSDENDLPGIVEREMLLTK